MPILNPLTVIIKDCNESPPETGLQPSTEPHARENGLKIGRATLKTLVSGKS